MADNKKYYYLKLKDNFFDSDEMIILESMPDGYLYSNILLKLYLRSLRYEGRLMFNNRIPFNSTMLAQVTRHSIGVVEKAMQIFKELNLIEIMDSGAIYMTDIQAFIGTSSTEADRKREYRQRIEKEKKGLLLKGQVSDKCPDKSPPEIEIEKELDIEIEIEEKEPPAPYEKIKDLYNNICTSLSSIRSVSSNRKEHIKARWKQFDYSLDTFKEAFELVESSKFLTGTNDRNWKADFDWLIKNDNNMLKVLEGRYTDSKNNKDPDPPKGGGLDMDHDYDMDTLEKKLLERSKGNAQN